MVLLLQLNGYFITPDSSTAIGAPRLPYSTPIFIHRLLGGFPSLTCLLLQGVSLSAHPIGKDHWEWSQDEAAKRLEVRPVAEVGCEVCRSGANHRPITRPPNAV